MFPDLQPLAGGAPGSTGSSSPSDRDPAAELGGGTFFGQLTDPERAGLHELGVKRGFPEDAVLMFQDEYDDRLLLLLSGRVKVTRTTERGHELLLAIRDAGDLLGELAFIDGQPRVATVTALEPVEALVLSGSRFRSYLERTPRVAVVLLESVASRFRESTLKRLQFAASDTLGRLSSRIVELADRYGSAGEDGIVVPLPISQDELASWTGASRAGVAQALQTLRELGWLSTERRKMIVRDVDSLRARSA
jgi:CRP/FNR family cyclic AMP-dependent transcriptional regulator